MVVIGLGKNLLFKSILAHCVTVLDHFVVEKANFSLLLKLKKKRILVCCQRISGGLSVVVLLKILQLNECLVSSM